MPVKWLFQRTKINKQITVAAEKKNLRIRRRDTNQSSGMSTHSKRKQRKKKNIEVKWKMGKKVYDMKIQMWMATVGSDMYILSSFFFSVFFFIIFVFVPVRVFRFLSLLALFVREVIRCHRILLVQIMICKGTREYKIRHYAIVVVFFLSVFFFSLSSSVPSKVPHTNDQIHISE